MNKEREELAWAAGFIDGEATFGWQRQKGKKPIFYLQAGQVNRYVLDRLQSALGSGKVYGPYKPRRKNDQPYHYFRLTGNEKVVDAVLVLWEWLSPVKRAQVIHCAEGLPLVTAKRLENGTALTGHAGSNPAPSAQ